VTRWPAELVALEHGDADLVRVNLFHPEVPRALGQRALGIPCAGAQLWPELSRQSNKTRVKSGSRAITRHDVVLRDEDLQRRSPRGTSRISTVSP
jgi:hypothetical protein